MEDFEALRDELRPKYPHSFIPNSIQDKIPLEDMTNKPQKGSSTNFKAN
jgi:hypothetical protein